MKTGFSNIRSLCADTFRIDPITILSEGNVYRTILKNYPYGVKNIKDCSERIFYGNIFSRIFVKDPSRGMTYLAASDTILSNLDTGKYLSLKQVDDLKYLILEKDWILVTCSGTIGNVTYTNKNFQNKIASHDLIRIVPNDKNILKGVVYAFLSSKYGYFQLTQSQFGGVVKHINEKHVGDICIPEFPEEFQKEVDELIQTSARLREEAADLLAEAVSYFDRLQIDCIIRSRTGLVHIHKLSTGFRRFDAQYQLGEQDHYKLIKVLQTKKISDLAEAIFIGNRDKRQYVETDGVPFLSSSDMILANPLRWCKYISKKAKALRTLQVTSGDILISRSGTVGNTIIVGENLNGAAVSEHALRLRINPEMIAPEYVFAFLQSRIGQNALGYLSYGSVIVTLGEDYVGDIDLPILDVSRVNDIVKLIKNYTSKWDQSIRLENKAISLVEAEIEKWNK